MTTRLITQLYFEGDPLIPLCPIVKSIANPDAVQTNIVVFHLRPAAADAATLVARARERGVLLFAFGPRTLRAVTHLDVSAEQCTRAGRTLAELI